MVVIVILSLLLLAIFSLLQLTQTIAQNFRRPNPFLGHPLSILSRLHNEILQKPGISAIL
jgi:hypothetical protein